MTPLPVATLPERTPVSAPSPAWSIQALTRGLAAGEEAAFREFHRVYFDRLYRLLLGLSRGAEAHARDALQETFCRVARYARTFADEEVFWCWLVAIARSAVRDAGRKHHRYWALLEDYARRWLPLHVEPEVDHPECLNRFLDDCLAELEPDDRTLVEEKYLNQTSTRDLAQSVGLSERAVESRLLRLRRRLRERLLDRLRQDQP